MYSPGDLDGKGVHGEAVIVANICMHDVSAATQRERLHSVG